MNRESIEIPVVLAPGHGDGHFVSADYVTPAPAAEVAVDVLVHGATYDRKYFDWPLQPERYSYTARTVSAGRAVLAYDRLGSGRSSRPLSTGLTLEAGASVLHQVITWARGKGHRQVHVIGHSLGSIIAMKAAALWPADPSRLVLTSILHTAAPGAQAAGRAMHSASDDPAFASKGYDGGYLTTVSGTRGELFHHASSDPAVIAYDEEHKDVVSATEFSSAPRALLAPPQENMSAQITAPVLAVVGELDYILCVNGPVSASSADGLRAHEAPYYRRAACFTVAPVPGTGHDLALSPTAADSFALIDWWLQGRPPQADRTAAASPRVS